MRLSGENREEGYSVYRIRETAFGGGTKLSAEDGFLQFMIERLFASSAPSETEEEEETEEGDDMKAYQSPEHYGFYDLCRKDPSGSHPSLGKKKPGSGKVT